MARFFYWLTAAILAVVAVELLLREGLAANLGTFALIAALAFVAAGFSSGRKRGR